MSVATDDNLINVQAKSIKWKVSLFFTILIPVAIVGFVFVGVFDFAYILGPLIIGLLLGLLFGPALLTVNAQVSITYDPMNKTLTIVELRNPIKRLFQTAGITVLQQFRIQEQHMQLMRSSTEVIQTQLLKQ
ncbi:MAG: hypothetical protein EZS28_034096 [Streblomastix strix]|uniref:Uncharacterized protein n=1 Tax=Streblomastix strix TaxID=222440 RepID=A0A5J4UIH2_9EUKA|nr:MAG: hypothetical protein EZS28_034096 [Streblomastix strix]